MKKELIIAKLVLEILSDGEIKSPISCSTLEFANNDENIIDIINMLFITHTQRYQNCYNEQSKENEILALLSDFHKLFNIEVMSDSLICNLFLLIDNKNYQSSEFRNICVQIIDQVDKCDKYKIRYALYQKLITIIIAFRLYVTEPYISILRRSTEEINTIMNEYGLIETLRLLE